MTALSIQAINFRGETAAHTSAELYRDTRWQHDPLKADSLQSRLLESACAYSQRKNYLNALNSVPPSFLDTPSIGREPVRVAALAPFASVAQLMLMHSTDIVCVYDQKGAFVDIITERDLLQIGYPEVDPELRVIDLCRPERHFFCCNDGSSLLQVLRQMEECRHVLITDRDQKPFEVSGTISQRDICNYLVEALEVAVGSQNGNPFPIEDQKIFEIIYGNTVGNLMRTRDDLVLVSSGDTIRKTIDGLNFANLGAALIVDSDHRPIGIFTEQDLARRVFFGSKLDEVPVGAAMTPFDPHSPGHLTRENFLFDAMVTLKDLNARQVVVVDERQDVAGILCQTQIRKYLLDELNALIQTSSFSYQHWNYSGGR